MVQWAKFPLSGKMNLSNDEVLLHKAMASIENGYPNDGGGQSRFPGLEWFAQFPGTRTYCFAHRGTLYAATDLGRLWRISSDREAEDVTGVPISGGKRVKFDETDDGLVMAAGGPIIQLTAPKTSLLSKDAPNSTHVGYLDGYLTALEAQSNRFYHSAPDDPTSWDPQDVFSANARPGPANALVITPYRELLISKPSSIEQWETLSGGDKAFSRRFASGQGCAFPYTLVTDATGTYGVTERFEFVRFAGQVSQDQSSDVSLALAKVDNWDEAWAEELTMFGSRFIILQMPNATNAYGTKGITLCYDYRGQKFMFLYGALQNGLPTRWPGWSFGRAYGKVFAGVPGGVAELSDTVFQNLGEDQRFLIRTPHVTEFGPSRIDAIRLRLKRGVSPPLMPLRQEVGRPYLREPYDRLNREAGPPQEGVIALRCNPDNRGFDEWQYEEIGTDGENAIVLEFGAQGSANSWQFEIMCSDAVPVEIADMEIWVERLSN